VKPELKSKWVEALRSGRYHQGQACLRDEQDRFCCLGVLADLLDSSRWKSGKEMPDLRDNYLWAGHDGFLPESEVDAIGLERQDVFSRLNDSGKSFAQIADYIERKL
jgi:hypothetical protein